VAEVPNFEIQGTHNLAPGCPLEIGKFAWWGLAATPMLTNGEHQVS